MGSFGLPATSFQLPTGGLQVAGFRFQAGGEDAYSEPSAISHQPLSKPRLSVVIVNYNTREDVRLCLSALRQSTLPTEVIVVDNASRDGSADMIRDEFPEVKLLTPNQNLWFCGGNNLGIRASSGEYVLMLNPDTIPQPDALRLMVDFLQAHPDYAGVTIQLRYPEATATAIWDRMLIGSSNSWPPAASAFGKRCRWDRPTTIFPHTRHSRFTRGTRD